MKRRDEQQDVILENIYDKVDKLHGKAKDMGGVSKTIDNKLLIYPISLFPYFYLSLFYCFAKEN